jgi:PmbA protein
LGISSWAIANTEGTAYSERVTEVSFSAALSRKEGGFMTKSVWDTISSHARVPKPEELLGKLIEEARMLKVRPKRINGERTVYLDPRAAYQLLDFLAEMFMADSVAKGESPLTNKLDEEVFSKMITLTDNPTLPGGPSSHGCDEEGVRGKPLPLIDHGKVSSYLADLYWGYKLGINGGRGFRPDPFSPPSPSYTNLTLHSGNAKPEGIVVTGLTGLHTASAETGYLSVVLSPAFEDGEHVEATLSANALDLFNELLLGVGSDGRWVSSVFTPGILVKAKLS